MKRGNDSLLGIGLYTLPEAARLTGVSSARIQRWVCGYSYKSDESVRRSDAIWEPDVAALNGSVALSFRDLMEVKFVDAFVKYGVRLPVIRVAAAKACKMVGRNHPFSTRGFKTDGRSIFAEIVKDEEDKILLDLTRSQYGFEKVISPSLYAGLEFGDDDGVIRWWQTPKRRIVLDPTRSFGQPIVARAGVPTVVLAEAVRANESVARVAAWYDIDKQDVVDAVAFENRLAA